MNCFSQNSFREALLEKEPYDKHIKFAKETPMHEPGRIYKVFISNTDEFLFQTDDLHHIIRTGQKKNVRLRCISENHHWDIYPGGRNIMSERKLLTPGLRKHVEKLYNKYPKEPRS